MSDKISFVFPAKAEFINAIRLAASGVACGFDFDVNKIEDIKSCIAEACLLLMCTQNCKTLNILLECSDVFRIRVCAIGAKKKESCQSCMEFNAEISRIMIQALAREVTFIEQNDVMSEVKFVVNSNSGE